MFPEATKMPIDSRGPLAVNRVRSEDSDVVWKIIEEYYQAAGVIARDSREDFKRLYFAEGAGVWLASAGGCGVGCIALRPLAAIPKAAEVKRLYVQVQYRGTGVARALYAGLESYARDFGYDALYLDTTEEMRAAQRFYTALGFALVPRYNNNPQATIFMRKNL
jgi:GNAT superfamily N-acetyltransferase